MSPDDFRHLLTQKTDQQLLDPCLRDEQPPYVFESDPPTWDLFRDELIRELGVVREDIRIIGSGRLGFSLKPNANLRRFSESSDIDVVIVSSDFFDRMWFGLLSTAYPRGSTASTLGGWLGQIRDQVYEGWLVPTLIRLDSSIYGLKAKPVRDLKQSWFNALKRAGQHPPRGHSDVKGRVYRTWRHAELYHTNSLAALRASLN